MIKRVILASGSPQRADVMRELGIDFNAVSMDVDEVILPTPEETVQENASLKALAAHDKFPNDVIIAADTVISHAGRVLGKPKDAQEAKTVLSALSGSDVMAVSAVAVINPFSKCKCIATESAVVRMRKLSQDDIAWYINMGEPLTRAGALGISRYGEIFIERIKGAYSCFAGLPKRALLTAIEKVGLATEILPNGMPLNSGIMTNGVIITVFNVS